MEKQKADKTVFQILISRVVRSLHAQADEEEKDTLKTRIETAIAALNDPLSPMSM